MGAQQISNALLTAMAATTAMVGDRATSGVAWGVGVGLGAIAYYGSYPYAYPYYGGASYYVESPDVVVVAPTYTQVEPAAMARSGQPVPQASRSADPIFYPKNGQSAATVESDRRECNRWATTQAGALNDASVFQRATLACMDGRGYSAR